MEILLGTVVEGGRGWGKGLLCFALLEKKRRVLVWDWGGSNRERGKDLTREGWWVWGGRLGSWIAGTEPRCLGRSHGGPGHFIWLAPSFWHRLELGGGRQETAYSFSVSRGVLPTGDASSHFLLTIFQVSVGHEPAAQASPVRNGELRVPSPAE